MSRIVIVGSQWGDEGKGKVIDALAENVDWIIRAQGGNNAGHTILFNGQEFKLHLIPTGILHPETKCAIAAGAVIDPEVLKAEMERLATRGIRFKQRFFISPSAHLIMPYHKVMDTLQEKRKGKVAIGTTKRGIGPCYSDKVNRIGIRMGDLIDPERFKTVLQSVLTLKNEELSLLFRHEPFSFDRMYDEYSDLAASLAPFVQDFSSQIAEDETLLFEGAQGTYLDVTSGTYPYVTSSHTTAAGICSGAEIAPNSVDEIIGVLKVYATRVGNGPFPTEMKSDDRLCARAAREVGTTTGRVRRIGWFDAVLARASVSLNGITSLAVTKLDILDSFEEIKICVAYQIGGKTHKAPPLASLKWEDIIPVYETLPGWKTPTHQCRSYSELPNQAKAYLSRLSVLSGAPISLVSVGPDRKQTLFLKRQERAKARG